MKRFYDFSLILNKYKCMLTYIIQMKYDSRVIEGHLLITDPPFLRYIFCVLNLMNANITKMQIFDDMKFNLIITVTYVLWTTFVLVFTSFQSSLLKNNYHPLSFVKINVLGDTIYPFCKSWYWSEIFLIPGFEVISHTLFSQVLFIYTGVNWYWNSELATRSYPKI